MPLFSAQINVCPAFDLGIWSDSMSFQMFAVVNVLLTLTLCSTYLIMNPEAGALSSKQRGDISTIMFLGSCQSA